MGSLEEQKEGQIGKLTGQAMEEPNAKNILIEINRLIYCVTRGVEDGFLVETLTFLLEKISINIDVLAKELGIELDE